MSDRPQRFFKYQPPSIYLLRNLASRTLHLSSPTVFNDPFDTVLQLESANVDPTEELERLSRVAYDYDEPSRIAAHMRVLRAREADFYSMSDLELRHVLVDAGAMLRNSVLVASLSTVDPFDPDAGPRMWSQYAGDYAGDYAGLCLEFAADADPFASAVQVDYQTVPPKIGLEVRTFDDVRPHLEERARCKHGAWKLEREWRVVDFTTENMDGELQYQIEALTSVHFGPRMNWTDMDIVAAILKSLGSECRLVRLSTDLHDRELNIAMARATPAEWMQDFAKAFLHQ